MKVARIMFNSPDMRRAYQDALRQRMYASGHEPHQVTEYMRLWFPPRKLSGFISGTADAERAADVAGEFRGHGQAQGRTVKRFFGTIAC